MIKIQIFQNRGLWIAHLQTVYGHMDLLCGEGDEPDIKALVFVGFLVPGKMERQAKWND